MKLHETLSQDENIDCGPLKSLMPTDAVFTPLYPTPQQPFLWVTMIPGLSQFLHTVFGSIQCMHSWEAATSTTQTCTGWGCHWLLGSVWSSWVQVAPVGGTWSRGHCQSPPMPCIWVPEDPPHSLRPGHGFQWLLLTHSCERCLLIPRNFAIWCLSTYLAKLKFWKQWNTQIAPLPNNVWLPVLWGYCCLNSLDYVHWAISPRKGWGLQRAQLSTLYPAELTVKCHPHLWVWVRGCHGLSPTPSLGLRVAAFHTL